jgi:sugar phosphate isomerase/epimerase
VRKEAEQLLLDTIDACAELDIPAILAPLTENDTTKGEPHGVQKDRWAAMLKVAGARADEKGVKIGLEGCARAYAKTAADVLELSERSGAASIGAYYDPANAMAAGLDPVAEIKLFGPRLKAFHVKDTKGNHLGEGQVDFPGVVAAVKENGYSGALILETPGKDDPIASARRNLEFTRKLFNG